METIARRTLMNAQNSWTPAEYKRMAMEKATALQRSTLADMSGRGTRAVLLAPRIAMGLHECTAPSVF
jgi:hypothetical protein